MRAIKQVEGVWRCFICGAEAPNQEQPHLGRCQCEPPPPTSRAGLGDMVAAGLSAIGVTERLVSGLLGRPCGCAGRRDALNRLGKRLGLG